MNIQTIIEEKLSSALAPSHLQVINESHMHNVPANSETHFKVIAVCEAFENKPLVQRHRKINALLKEELEGGVHALGLHTLTPAEWQLRQEKVADSPKCHGGSNTD